MIRPSKVVIWPKVVYKWFTFKSPQVKMGSLEVSAERRMKELETLFLRGPYNSASLKESAAFRYTIYSGHEKEVEPFSNSHLSNEIRLISHIFQS